MNSLRLSLSALALVVGLVSAQPAPAQKAPGQSPQAVELQRRFAQQFDRPRVPLDTRLVSRETRGELVIEQVSFASERDMRVPALVVRPAKPPRALAAVVCLHGLGGKKEGMLPYLEEMARRGLLAIAIDARCHGDRADDLRARMVETYKGAPGRPYLWDTVWDTWRTLDYLQSRSDVDGARLGVMGISLGGHTTWMASADPRVKVAIPCISACSWRWQLESGGYAQRVKNVSKAYEGVAAAMGEKEITARVVREAWKKWHPGIPETYDCQDLLAAFAPRPLLLINGDSDPVAPLEGLKIAQDTIAAAYRKAGFPEREQLNLAENSGHTITASQKEAILKFLCQWL